MLIQGGRCDIEITDRLDRFRRGDRIIGCVDIDAQSKVLLRFSWFYTDPNDLSRCPRHLPDLPTAEEAMDRVRDVLARYPGATVDTPFLYSVGDGILNQGGGLLTGCRFLA